MDPENAVARLNQAIAAMADEVKLQDFILRSLPELRTQYRQSPERFSPQMIANLQRIARLADAIHEFRDSIDDADDARTRDEAMDVAAQLESLRTRLWPPMLAMRLDKELREVAERAAALPEAPSLKRSSARRRIVAELQSTAAPCPRCGQGVVLRETRDGSFWGCSSFPRCFGSRALNGDERTSLESAH
jgi:topoisomerase-like DNA binding C4 zinc finger protein